MSDASYLGGLSAASSGYRSDIAPDQNAEERTSLATGSATSHSRSENVPAIIWSASRFSRSVSVGNLNVGAGSATNSHISTSTRTSSAQTSSPVDRLCKVRYIIVIELAYNLLSHCDVFFSCIRFLYSLFCRRI